MDFIGEVAGLATSIFFALTSLIFASTGRMVGSQVTNRVRLIFALLYLAVLNAILFGEPLPLAAEPSRWIWLSLSGVIGLSLGDAFHFQSLVSVGPRLGSLLLSLAPIFGSVIAWIFFGETLTFLQIMGILLALSGIAWVVMSHVEPPDTPHGFTRRGVFFGVLAGLGQATGLVLSRQGMFGEFSPFQANIIRMQAGTVIIWSLIFLQGSAGGTRIWCFVLSAGDAAYGDRRGKHPHGAAAGHPATRQLFCVQGKARLAGGGRDVSCDPWCRGLISGIMTERPFTAC